MTRQLVRKVRVVSSFWFSCFLCRFCSTGVSSDFTRDVYNMDFCSSTYSVNSGIFCLENAAPHTKSLIFSSLLIVRPFCQFLNIAINVEGIELAYLTLLLNMFQILEQNVTNINTVLCLIIVNSNTVGLIQLNL